MLIGGKPMKIKTHRVFIIMVISIILPLIIYLMGKMYFSTRHIYELNWNIKLPSKLHEIYNYKREMSFRGDGYRYTVYKAQNNFDFDEMFIDLDNTITKKTNGDFTSAEKSKIETIVKDIVSNLNIHETYLPPFEYKYLWSKLQKPYNDVFIIIYFMDSCTLYLIEKLS